ncbi:MAG: hypothetical protein DDT34_01357 [Firmicutes bacterium]|nr:hypothetical protein [Bacillota bacterium]
MRAPPHSGIGVITPDVIGFEEESPSNGVAIEAEMAWMGFKLLVLAPNQATSREACEALGWRVVVAIGDDWPKDVERALESKE